MNLIEFESSKDSPTLDAMSVHWSSKGFCIHTTLTAMSLCAVMHRELSLSERCENALTAFVALDLFTLLSEDLCTERHLPRGSLFVARQTTTILQSCALAGIIICLTKPNEFAALETGFGRCSEIPIEQHFGHLRTQYASGQMTTRAFMMASARQAHKISKILAKYADKPRQQRVQEPLTDQELLASTKWIKMVHRAYSSIFTLFIYVYICLIYVDPQ